MSTPTTLPAEAADKQTVLVERYFTKHNQLPEHVYRDIEWGIRDVVIWDSVKNKAAFEQKGVEFPKSWSDTAVKIVTQKYFKGAMGSPKREWSLKQLIDRVVATTSQWGIEGGYFGSGEDAETFEAELTYLLVNQMASFNSPVWFNVGLDEEKPQCSACFINSVEDNMESILSLYVREGLIFKNGSGSGTNLSNLRSSREFLSGGGRPSGPVSFMKGFDANAGQIKSGGRTRRAAIMRILNVDHGDIREFIACKGLAEKKAQALIGAGYSAAFDDPEGAYGTVSFQNANNSIRVSDEFMKAVEKDEKFWTKTRTGEKLENLNARDIMHAAAVEAHASGDPGIQFHDTINDWNPVADIRPINSSNPCSEYMFIDDSACNLASLNLMKFIENGEFDFEAFKKAVRVTLLAMEIFVGRAGYPTPEIEKNSHDFRPLGLGYANLGALLMVSGVPYDSDRGRCIAAMITSLMGAAAYEMSADMASVVGAFEYWGASKRSFMKVLNQHLDASVAIPRSALEGAYQSVHFEACDTWARSIGKAKEHGVRNGQVTVLAPTGTIGFMMDCATTGIEPELSLVKYKTLVGGGHLKLVNPLVEAAMITLGYSHTDAAVITNFVNENGSIENAPIIRPEHLSVFDTSFGQGRTIHHMGHVRMMAAVQPFLSGAISKTVNMPTSATVEDIEQTYLQAWKIGLKSIAMYRDGCKQSQPLSTTLVNEKAEIVTSSLYPRVMPDERQAIIHKFRIGGHSGYLTVGLYEDGTPGEIFIDIAKEGSTVSGLLDAFAIQTSFALQQGVPLSRMIKKFSHMSFEPSGWTGHKELRQASSIVDYIFRYLKIRFPGVKDKPALETATADNVSAPVADYRQTLDAPNCGECGACMSRNGACYKCENCGGTSGCS